MSLYYVLGADSVQLAWKRESNTPCVRSQYLEMSQIHMSVVFTESNQTHLSGPTAQK
jgi:hypothetical protein